MKPINLDTKFVWIKLGTYGNGSLRFVLLWVYHQFFVMHLHMPPISVAPSHMIAPVTVKSP